MKPESPAPQPPPGEATRPIKRLGDPPGMEWVPGRLSFRLQIATVYHS